MKTMVITDILTYEEILKAIELKEAKLICEQLIQPNMERINKSLGQENNAMYLAYAVEYVVSKHITK